MFKKYFLIFLALLCFSLSVAANESDKADPVFTKEDLLEETDTNEAETDEKNEINLHYYKAHRKKAVNRWRRGPKAEHIKIKEKGDIFVEKRKEEFETRVQNELYLLRDEYEALDYHP